jgi:hypothetical protein
VVVVVLVVGAACRLNCTAITPRFAEKLLDPSALIGGSTADLYAVPVLLVDVLVGVCGG